MSAAYCNKCESYRSIEYTGKVEGSRLEVRCVRCKTLFWILW